MKITQPSPAAKSIVIGCAYTGKPAYHADTTKGTYWEVLPEIAGHALIWQQQFLDKDFTKPKESIFKNVVDKMKSLFKKEKHVQ